MTHQTKWTSRRHWKKIVKKKQLHFCNLTLIRLKCIASVSTDSIEEARGTGFKSNHKLTGYRLILQQITALYIKRFHSSRRSIKGIFCEVRINLNATF
jgi:hypothetical protein